MTKESQLPHFCYFDKGNLAVVVKNLSVAERVRDDERFLGLARQGLDLHTVSGCGQRAVQPLFPVGLDVPKCKVRSS